MASRPLRLRSQLTAPALHVLLFALTWGLYWVQNKPLMDGPSGLPFAVLFIADVPISFLFFGAMWNASWFTYALIAWGVLGTIWWYFLGRLILSRKTSA